jgi:hypothetical protein
MAGTVLPPGFTFSYNGVQFGTYSNFSASMQPIRDEAQRTVICLHFQIKAKVVVTTSDNPTTDTTLLTMQRMLSEDGGRLIISGVGLGNIDVNAPGGSVWDVNWGPKCTMGEWTPLGSNIAAQVDVTIDTWIPVCESAVYRSEVMAFNYDIDWSILDGLTSRTIAGYLEIPITRWNGQAARTVPDQADAYRDRLDFTVPIGFRRRPARYHLSADRKRLDFSITDEEVESDLSPPEGVIEIQCRQTTENDKPLSFVTWVGSISTTARCARGVRRADVMAAILKDIRDRLNKIILGAKPNGNGNVTNLLLRKIRFVEEWYAREIGVDVQYWFSGDIQTVMAQSGMWTTVPSNDWNKWRTSMDKTWSIRGHAELAYNASDDAIIDLCTRQTARLIASDGTPPMLRAGTLNSLFGVGKPSPNETWIDYRTNLVHQRNEGTVKHKLSQALEPQKIAAKEWLNPDTTSAPRIGVREGLDDVVQSISTPSYKVFLVGTATRVGVRIPKPELLRVNGADVTKHGQDTFLESPVGNTPAGTIYKAIWAQEYVAYNATESDLDSGPNHNQWVPSTLP